MRSNRAGVCFGAPISEAEAITSAAHSVLCWQQGQKGSHALPGGKYKIDFDRMRQGRVGNESKRRHVRRKAGVVRPARSFQVGDKVHRRDGTNAWGIGFVTSLVPLKVTASSADPSATGYTWDEVKAL